MLLQGPSSAQGLAAALQKPAVPSAQCLLQNVRAGTSTESNSLLWALGCQKGSSITLLQLGYLLESKLHKIIQWNHRNLRGKLKLALGFWDNICSSFHIYWYGKFRIIAHGKQAMVSTGRFDQKKPHPTKTRTNIWVKGFPLLELCTFIRSL